MLTENMEYNNESEQTKNTLVVDLYLITIGSIIFSYKNAITFFLFKFIFFRRRHS